METQGYIYILTNPSFPQFVKIGYADDVEKRLQQLNRSECIPFSFRLYAYYKVSARLTDMKLHALIDKLNPNLRSIEYLQGKKRVREFYAMSAQDAFNILETIAEINNLRENLVLVEPSNTDIENENAADEIRTKRSVTQLPRMDWLLEQGLVHIGDRIHVINHPEEVAIIVDENNVEYQGAIMSFLKYGCTVTGWKAIQTYAMMKIVDEKETLSVLRERRMRELGMLDE
jgi:hypothetical protein